MFGGFVGGFFTQAGGSPMADRLALSFASEHARIPAIRNIIAPTVEVSFVRQPKVRNAPRSHEEIHVEVYTQYTTRPFHTVGLK